MDSPQSIAARLKNNPTGWVRSTWYTLGMNPSDLAPTPRPLITDDQTLSGATGRFGHKIEVYDDGFGPLWIHRDSMGITGIVRAQKWSEAYEIAEDEFFPEASETIEEMKKDYGEDFMENPLWQEAFGTRPNGPRPGKWENGTPKDPLGHGIYAKDLNGDRLDPLTPELLKELEIKLEIVTPDLEPWEAPATKETDQLKATEAQAKVTEPTPQVG